MALGGIQNRFHSGACSVCFRSPPDICLQYCTRCRLVGYCGKEHQVSDWPSHKQFCAACKDIPKKPDFDVPWRSYPQAFLRTLNGVLNRKFGRSVNVREGNIIFSLQSCSVCQIPGVIAPLVTCAQCHSAYHCKAHADQFSSVHTASACANHALNVACDRLTVQNNYALPVWISDAPPWTEPQPLPRTWDEYFRVRCAPEDASPVLRTCWTETLTLEMTLLYLLQECDPEVFTRQSLAVELIGADMTSEMESFGRLNKFEEMLHMLPALRELHITLIGPSLDEQLDLSSTLCGSCQSSGRRLQYTAHRVVYEEYIRSGKQQHAPDVCMAFNCGIHEFWGTRQDTWSETVRLLCARSGLLIGFTSYNPGEAKGDVAVFESRGARVVMKPRANPFKALQPFGEPLHVEDFFFANAMLSAVRAT